jgi:chromosome transmission fidelity protein 4
MIKDCESVSNDIEQIKEDKELIPKWFERASSMLTETKPIELQESFQSTSTSKYLESRFLIWNNIGAITCYSEQIQISFHDVSYHHSITIDNKTDKYSLGDLSLSAIVLASSQTGKFLCILYQSWDSNMREWTINVENNDKIEIVSLCEDFIAIGTSQRLIRLMSLSGIQQRIIRLQGPILSMSAYQNQLWIIHHSTQGFQSFIET